MLTLVERWWCRWEVESPVLVVIASRFNGEGAEMVTLGGLLVEMSVFDGTKMVMVAAKTR